jgi:LPS export ABC transporter protein LptC
MAIFQTKKIQSFIIFIIVLAAILWMFQDNILRMSFFEKTSDNIELNQFKYGDSSYLEKIDNFNVKEYSDNQKILHIMTADTYFSYRDSPVQLVNIKVTTFNENQKEGLTLNANLAQINKQGEIFFNGDVLIKTKNNAIHEINSESLMYISDDGVIKSNQDVVYTGEASTINSQGMLMNINSDKLLLNGVVNISHKSGSLLESSNLSINHFNDEKVYQSKERTIYRSTENEITADAGFMMNMNNNLTNLLGNVKFIGAAGTTMYSSNLIVDQSNDSEVFKTNDPTKYNSPESNIRSNKMYYDTSVNKIKLTGNVVAIYE